MRAGFNPELCRIKTNAKGVAVDHAFIAHLQMDASVATAASTTGIHAALDGSAHVGVTTGITQPSIPRNITATAGGTATDIKAIQVTIEGTNYNDDPITETLPAFTADTAGTVSGTKAFKTVTKITIPAHDGTGATTAIGFGEVLGLPYTLDHNTVLATYKDNVKEGTAPAVSTNSTALESNTVKLNSVLNSKVVDVYLMV